MRRMGWQWLDSAKYPNPNNTMPLISHLGLFPWCFKAEDTFFETKERIAKEAVPMWWRVKKWNMSASVTIRYNTDPPTTETQQINQDFDVTYQTGSSFGNKNIEKEKDLVCAQYGYTNGTSEHVWGIQNFVDSYLVVGPKFEVFLFQDDVGFISSQKTYADMPDVTKIGQIEVVAEDLNINFIADMFAQTGGAQGLATFIAIDGKLTATEYWPYASI